GALARVLREDGEVVLLAVKAGDVRRERVGAVLPLGGLELEEAHVVVEGCDAERAQPSREARIHHLALRFRQADAGELVDALADQGEMLAREREFTGGERLLHRRPAPECLSRGAHATPRAVARAGVARAIELTSRMRATRPSPRMVAPATPGTACRFPSSDFTTSC